MKFIGLYMLIWCLLTNSSYASAEENVDGLSTDSYNIQIINVCASNEEECKKLKFSIYERRTNKTIQAYGEVDQSKRLLDDGTFSGSKVLGYKIIFESELWYIGIPFGRLTKYDKNGKVIFTETGEWI